MITPKNTAASLQKKQVSKGFMTILIGLYSFQDCVHFLASVRRFHPQTPVLILIDQVPWGLRQILKSFGQVILVPAPVHPNPVLASRLAKLALYQASPFEESLYLDADICLLANIDEVFDGLEEAELLVTPDVQPSIAKATNLVRQPKVIPGGNQVEDSQAEDSQAARDVLSILRSVGLPLDETSIQYNGGFLGFRKSANNAQFFERFRQYFQVVCDQQELLQLKDQGAFASALATTPLTLQVLPPTYNFLDKWRKAYTLDPTSIKVLHCTYPYRPQFAKNVTRTLMTRLFDRWAGLFLPNQTQNHWRTSKASDGELSRLLS